MIQETILAHQAAITLATVLVLLFAMLRNIAPPDVLFIGATSMFALLGIITPEQAFAGFANPGMLTVAFLFVVVAGLRETGMLDWVGRKVIGSVSTEKSMLSRLAFVIIPMSAFLNNTPIVAMFVPVVMDWCRRNKVSPSKVLIPLSYLTILGGTCTLIGTSTNLVVDGLMVQNNLPGMTLLELGKVGVPYAIIGFLYLYFFGSKLLPERKELLEQLSDARREYLVEMLVQPGCRLNGQTVEKAGLRQLPGLFLIEIDRGGETLGPVKPEDLIYAEDRLVFTGVVSSIIELEKIQGLVPVADPGYEVSPKARRSRRLCEVVISHTSPLVGKTIREAQFRDVYGAAVVAVHRSGKRLEQKIGEISVEPGDTLLLQTPPTFTQQYRHDPAFYLVSSVADWRPVRHENSWLSLIIFLGLIVLMTTNAVPIVVSTAVAAVLMVATRCLSTIEARRSLEWQTLLTIGAAFGVGSALQSSGAAKLIADNIFGLIQDFGPIAALIAIYVLGSLVTEVITNNAAAVLIFPFCLETAKLYNVDPRPFMIALTLAASASFMTPIGYQTNMMVYGPGGYKFSDFVKVGGILNFLLAIVAMILIPIFWPFTPVAAP